MKVYILYDSLHGNTERIAQAMLKGIKSPDTVSLASLDRAEVLAIKQADLLVVGSPTQAGRPTQALKKLIANLPANALEGKSVAAFDTRFAKKEHGVALRVVMGVLGFAAPHIAAELQSKGGILVVPPVGYIVEDKEGPLAPQETGHATAWIKKVVHAAREEAIEYELSLI